MTINNYNIMPLVGSGKRFQNEGYLTLKPLIKVNNIPMFIRAASSFEKKNKWIFILRKNKFTKDIIKLIYKRFAKSTIITLLRKTDGQARTVFKAKNKINQTGNIFVTSCDASIEYNKKELYKKLKVTDFLVFIQKPRVFNLKNSKNFGWIKIKNKKIIKSSCKSTVSSNPKKDWIIVGAFAFKNKDVFVKILSKLFLSKKKINNEFYLDSCIEIAQKLNLKVSFVKIKKYISWGTPTELRKNFYK